IRSVGEVSVVDLELLCDLIFILIILLIFLCVHVCILISKFGSKDMLLWKRGFAFVFTENENLWIGSRLIWFEHPRPPERSPDDRTSKINFKATGSDNVVTD
ncbi:hypothetical protein STEG23_029944, partial [Scotinomys teguina]